MFLLEVGQGTPRVALGVKFSKLVWEGPHGVIQLVGVFRLQSIHEFSKDMLQVDSQHVVSKVFAWVIQRIVSLGLDSLKQGSSICIVNLVHTRSFESRDDMFVHNSAVSPPQRAINTRQAIGKGTVLVPYNSAVAIANVRRRTSSQKVDRVPHSVGSFSTAEEQKVDEFSVLLELIVNDVSVFFGVLEVWCNTSIASTDKIEVAVTQPRLWTGNVVEAVADNRVSHGVWQKEDVLLQALDVGVLDDHLVKNFFALSKGVDFVKPEFRRFSGVREQFGWSWLPKKVLESIVGLAVPWLSNNNAPEHVVVGSKSIRDRSFEKGEEGNDKHVSWDVNMRPPSFVKFLTNSQVNVFNRLVKSLQFSHKVSIV
mmetsp:Transcript_23461/g.32802  ORF Transcript_23461/g.32802 Transcript_23461/m.32802 type:complete len:368 (+) Transcript_23461:1856-2959(+)